MESVKCPKCGSEMTQGYIYAERRLKWAEDNRKNIASFNDKTILPFNIGIHHKKYVAFECEKCQVITFEY